MFYICKMTLYEEMEVRVRKKIKDFEEKINRKDKEEKEQIIRLYHNNLISGSVSALKYNPNVTYLNYLGTVVQNDTQGYHNMKTFN